MKIHKIIGVPPYLNISFTLKGFVMFLATLCLGPLLYWGVVEYSSSLSAHAKVSVIWSAGLVYLILLVFSFRKIFTASWSDKKGGEET